MSAPGTNSKTRGKEISADSCQIYFANRHKCSRSSTYTKT